MSDRVRGLALDVLRGILRSYDVKKYGLAGEAKASQWVDVSLRVARRFYRGFPTDTPEGGSHD